MLISFPVLGPRGPVFARLGALIALGVLIAGPVGAEMAITLNSGDDTVSLIDTETYKETARIYIGKEPHHLMATPDDRYLIVANAAGNDMVFLDPISGQIQQRLSRISDPYQIGFSPDQRWFVANSLRLNRVDIYHAADFTLAKHLTLPKMPSHLIFNGASSLVFVTLQESDEVAAIDLTTQEIKWKLPVGRQPAGIWMTPDDRYLLVAMTGADYVEVIDWRVPVSVKKITTGKGAHNFLAMGDGRRVLLSNRMADTVSIIDQSTLTVLESFPVPGGPDDMELRRDGRELWVSSRWIKQVTVIDMQTKKISHRIPVGRSPHGIYFHSHAARK